MKQPLYDVCEVYDSPRILGLRLMQLVVCKTWFYFLCISIFNLDCSGSGRKGGLVPGVSSDGFDDGGESKAVVDDYKFKLQKAEQDINTLQTNVSRTPHGQK